jgi:NagD protein
MALGTEGLTGPPRSAGLEVMQPVRGRAVDAILAGWYRQFSVDALEAACDAVWRAPACTAA